ncbi:MAG: DUF433 domain-containing protein [Hormoscilla sp. SP5CHS1]|nr:DUF433 domain-containing protein [Hormoscilla sp. SP12CHS1]MBC6453192.1 DUF433 domain-containing protein [Hormoscilla sp. SP5CHS1]
MSKQELLGAIDKLSDTRLPEVLQFVNNLLSDRNQSSRLQADCKGLWEYYFNFLAADDIRIKGHRIGIETVLYEYLYRERTPEEIAKIYTTLTLEEVYATILYYLHNKEAVSKYIADWLEWGHQQRKAQALNPHPAAARLRKIKAERQAQANGSEISDG